MSKYRERKEAQKARTTAVSNPHRKILQPKSINQENYIISMVENDVTVCTGPAGSGKSSVAVGLAGRWKIKSQRSLLLVQQLRMVEVLVIFPVIKMKRFIHILCQFLKKWNSILEKCF